MSQKIATLLKDYSAWAVALLTLLPLVMASAMILRYTTGDITLTNYILQRAGLFNVWIQGFTDVIGAVIASVLVLGVIYWWKAPHDWGRFTVGITCMLLGVTVIPLIFLLTIVCVEVVSHIKRKSGKKPKDEKDKTKRPSIILSLSLIAVSIMFAYPYLPYTQLDEGNGKKITVRVLVHDGEGYMGEEKDSRKIVSIPDKVVLSETICKPKEELLGHILGATIAGELNRYPKLNDC